MSSRKLFSIFSNSYTITFSSFDHTIPVPEFTGCLKQENIQISMDGRGRCYDNIFIERLWRSLKYELIYIYSFEDGKHLTEEVKKWFNFYNKERFHQALEYQMPDQVYWTSLNLA
jgi:putative transposase